jgi:hypothetical protein
LFRISAAAKVLSNSRLDLLAILVDELHTTPPWRCCRLPA